VTSIVNALSLRVIAALGARTNVGSNNKGLNVANFLVV